MRPRDTPSSGSATSLAAWPPPVAPPLSRGSSYPTTLPYTRESPPATAAMEATAQSRRVPPRGPPAHYHSPGPKPHSARIWWQRHHLLPAHGPSSLRTPLLLHVGPPSSECNPPSRFAAKSGSTQPAFEPPRPQPRPQLATSSSGCIFPSESLMTSLPLRIHSCANGPAWLPTHVHQRQEADSELQPQSRKTMTRRCRSGQ